MVLTSGSYKKTSLCSGIETQGGEIAFYAISSDLDNFDGSLSHQSWLWISCVDLINKINDLCVKMKWFQHLEASKIHHYAYIT